MVADKFPNGLIGPNPIGPIGPNRPYYPQNSTSISEINFLLEAVRCGASKKKTPWDSTRSTARGVLLLAMCRRLRLITRN